MDGAPVVADENNGYRLVAVLVSFEIVAPLGGAGVHAGTPAVRESTYPFVLAGNLESVLVADAYNKSPVA